MSMTKRLPLLLLLRELAHISCQPHLWYRVEVEAAMMCWVESHHVPRQWPLLVVPLLAVAASVVVMARAPHLPSL